MDKVTRQCPQTTTFLKRKESRSGIEPRSFRLPSVGGQLRGEKKCPSRQWRNQFWQSLEEGAEKRGWTVDKTYREKKQEKEKKAG